MVRRTEVGLVNIMGLVQGLALVTFPAASSIFTSPHGFGFSASRYGMMFIPQVALAILASSLGPDLAQRWTLKRVLQAGLGADLLAMILLAGSRLLADVPDAAYAVLLVATGSLGFGFGAAVMAMNTYAQTFAPGHEDRSVLVLNALLGAGTALAPLFVAIFIGAGAWWLMPLMVAAALTALLLLSTKVPLDASVGNVANDASAERLPGRFWLFAAAVFLYGVAETLNGNWSGPYLTSERGLSAEGASFALMAFWAMVTVGRMCISLSGQACPPLAAAMSGELVAFYQAGHGVAAFGVGPLREMAGLSFHAIYSWSSVIAVAMFAVAFALVQLRRPLYER